MNDAGLEPLLDYLKRQRGFDFTGYKRSTIERRVGKRMDAVHVDGYAAYLDYLEVHPEEFAELFNTMLINVTSFHRDPEAWKHLASEVIPGIVAGKAAGEQIRVWCAGCATGEETYTVAMVLAEALGMEDYLDRVKIYATDLDDEALETARHAVYEHKQVATLSPELLDRYFERTDRRYMVIKDLRRPVIFGRNDLVQDAPISRIDILLCRNTLMYFNVETQARILARFHFALNPTGVLFLGKSEMLIAHSDLFTPVNLRRRVFRKVPRGILRERLFTRLDAPGIADQDEVLAEAPAETLAGRALDTVPLACIAIDHAGRLQLANAAARTMLGIRAEDLGRPLNELEASYRPLEIRSHLDVVRDTRRIVALDAMWVPQPGGTRLVYDVRLAPLVVDGEVVGATVIYRDVSEAERLRSEVQQSKLELEQSYEELQSTVEELETMNEELQSTNEELETTNEELQATNEELETMNEELHSTNEELETMNDELRERTLQLNDANAFLETILTNLHLAVVVLDRALNVRVWNAVSADYWGLRPDETEGRSFLELDIGLPVHELSEPLRACIDGRSEREQRVLDAINRRGRPVSCNVTALPSRGIDGRIDGAVVLMEVLPSGDGARPAPQRRS
jgi:two-component system, chemotaxis family, CheB/CheR fusion protein